MDNVHVQVFVDLNKNQAKNQPDDMKGEAQTHAYTKMAATWFATRPVSRGGKKWENHFATLHNLH